jgi:5-methylcytosine-specific restriction endonuclease McrA
MYYKGKRPFKCPFCMKSYKRKTMFLKHLEEFKKNKKCKYFKLKKYYIPKNIKKVVNKRENYDALIGENNPNWNGGMRNYQMLKYRKTFLSVQQKCSVCGTTKERLLIHHIDRNYKNNRLDNCQVVCRGCHNRIHFIGVNNPRHKITEKEVKEIRKKNKKGISQKELAKEYGVIQPHISKIIRRVSWKHIK